ncbi:MAG: methyltransferase domain-containing protein [Planctomycetales bacterium]|nr:methyltransferase domain-containing protein [Planctomycetales bacterium]
MIAATQPSPPTTAGPSPTAAPRAITMPGVHAAVQEAVRTLPRGSLLDVGAGEGAFSLWAVQEGFAVTAADVDTSRFRVPEVPCLQTDLGGPWPFPDQHFDLVVAVEVMEHVENHYHFLRQCARICKPGGHLVISTPNCHSIESRINYLLTGYDDCAPRPIDHVNPKFGSIYMEHIHPVPISTMELGLRMNGCRIEKLNFNRHRKLSRCLLPVLYPFLWWRTYRQLILSERSESLRQRNRGIMKLLLNPRLLTGRVAVYTCRKLETSG